MEFCIFGIKSCFVIVLFSALPIAACSNVDCNGKAFHCVNSTHFKICVDLGGGISTTVDEFLIPCPQDTVCKSYNLFECEYEQTTTTPVTIQSKVTNEQIQTSEVSLWERPNLTTLISFDHNQSAGLYQKQNIFDNVYGSFSTTLPTNEIFDTKTADSANFTQTSIPELIITENISFSPVTTTETSLYNINQSESENNAGNTDNPLYSTFKYSVTNDYVINEKNTLYNSSGLSERLKNDENISHVTHVSESTESSKVQTDLENHGDMTLKQDTKQILNKSNLLLPNNIIGGNNHDNKTTSHISNVNIFNFTINNHNFGFSTDNPLPNITSVNGNSETNLLFMTTSLVESNQTDETFKVNLYEPNTDKIPEYIFENRTISNPTEKTGNQFGSTIDVNTDNSNGVFKNSEQNLENMNNLFNSTDSYNIMATSVYESTTIVNGNEITSQMNTNLDNGLYRNINTDLHLDTENSTLINKEQISKKEILNLNNASHSTTLLDNLNNTNDVFSTEPYLPDEKLVPSTQAVTLIAEVVDEIQSPTLYELVNFVEIKETTRNPTSSLFLNITAVPTEATSYSEIKNKISITEDLIYTTEKSSVNTYNDLLFKKITTYEPRVSSTLILNNTVFNTAFTESAIMETGTSVLSDMTALPVSTDTNVTNEMQKNTLIGSDILVTRFRPKKKLFQVTTEFEPHSEMSDKKYISTEKPFMLHSTIVVGNKEHVSDSNSSDSLVKRDRVVKDKNFTSSLVNTETTTSSIYNTVPNKVTIDPLSFSTNKLLPVNDILDRVPDGQKIKESKSMIIENGDTNGRQVDLLLLNVTPSKIFINSENFNSEIKHDHSSTDIFAPSEKQLITIPMENEDSGLKTVTNFLLTTPEEDPVSNYSVAFTTQTVVEQHLTKSNTVLPIVTDINEYSFNSTQTDFSNSNEPRMNSITNYEKNNTGYQTTSANLMILTNATRLDTSTELIWISLNNETEWTKSTDNSLNETQEAILRNATEVNNVANISDILYKKISLINDVNTMGTDILATTQSKDGVNDIYTDEILEKNAKTSLKSLSNVKSYTSTGILRDSNKLKSRGIDLNLVSKSRKSSSNTSINTSIEPVSYIYSHITTPRESLMENTTVTIRFLDKKMVRDKNSTKPKTELILLSKIGLSNNSEPFDDAIMDKNNNTKNIYNQETLNTVEKLYSVGGNREDFNRTEKTLFISDTNTPGKNLNGVSQSSFETNFTKVNNFSRFAIQKNIALASPVEYFGITNKSNRNEYKASGFINENLPVHSDVTNYIQYVNKTETSKLTVNLMTTTPLKEKDLRNTLFKPLTREGNRSYDFANNYRTSSSLERETLNDNKNNIIINNTTFNGVIEGSNQIAKSNGVFQSNSSENILTPLIIRQASSREINKTSNIVSNNLSAHEFAFKNMWNQDSYSRILNKTSGPNSDNFVLSLSSKTNLSRSMTNVLPTAFEDLSRNILIENEANRIVFKTINYTSNYSNNENLLTYSIKVSSVSIKSKSNEAEEKRNSPTLIYHHYETNTPISTENNEVTEVMKGNTNIIPTTTAKVMHADARYNDKQRKQEFVCTKRGKYSDHVNCNKFYICFGRNSPIIGICPPRTVFSEILKQCTKNVAHCIRNDQFKCTTTGRFINILSNNTYFICHKRKIGFLRLTFQCQKGYYLNKRNIKCTPDLFNISTSNEGSNNSKEGSVEKSREGEINNNKYFECNREGKFEDKENCRRYYVCKKGKNSTFRRRLKKCDSDEVFHKKKKKCVDEESYECNI